MTTLEAAHLGADLEQPGRDHRLDALRGVAILLMVLDHVLVMASPGHWLRYTVTRASLPLFALVAGHLWRRGWRLRYLTVGAASFPAWLAGDLIGIRQPDVLVVILLGFLLVAAVDTFELQAAGTLFVALLLLAVAETGWHWTYGGYDPRWVGGLMLMGRVVDPAPLGQHLEHVRGLVVVGRYPLTVYVGHLAALAIAARFLGFGVFAP